MDKYLSKTETIGVAADTKVKITIKYVPTKLPANPNPSYGVSSIDINEAYLEEIVEWRVSLRPPLERYER